MLSFCKIFNRVHRRTDYYKMESHMISLMEKIYFPERTKKRQEKREELNKKIQNLANFANMCMEY